MSGLFVMVVEDDSDCAAVLEEALVLAGHRVAVAATAAEALALAERGPELAIVDGHLGGDTGLELIRSLRRGSFGAAPAILATGMRLDEVSTEARASGVDEVLVKPIVLSLLLDAVARLGGTNQNAGSARSAPLLGRPVLGGEGVGDPA